MGHPLLEGIRQAPTVGIIGPGKPGINRGAVRFVRSRLVWYGKVHCSQLQFVRFNSAPKGLRFGGGEQIVCGTGLGRVDPETARLIRDSHRFQPEIPFTARPSARLDPVSRTSDGASRQPHGGAHVRRANEAEPLLGLPQQFVQLRQGRIIDRPIIDNIVAGILERIHGQLKVSPHRR